MDFFLPISRSPLNRYRRYTFERTLMNRANPRTKQLRLLLPEDWIPELDSLAASRFQSRLATIRFYLRAGMNEDLARLAEHFRDKALNQKTHQQLKKHLSDNER